MKVVHVITGLEAGGAEHMLYRLLSRFDRDKVCSVVISLRGGGHVRGDIEALGVKVFSPEMEPGRPTLLQVKRFLQFIDNLQPDLIEGWLHHGTFAATIAERLVCRGKPLIWNVRQTITDLHDEPRSFATIVRASSWLSRIPRTILYNSRQGASQHESLGFDPAKTQIVPNGFDTERFKPCPLARREIRVELGLEPNAIIIGHLARYHPMKNHRGFLDAMAMVLSKRPNLHVVMAGPGVVSENAALTAQIESLAIGNRVSLLGPRRDVHRLTAAFDLAVSSSISNEGFPNVLGEAMASGVPCVATDIGEARWLLDGDGIVVSPNDTVALATACAQVLDWDDNERTQRTLLGRQRITSEFSIETVAKLYENLYQSFVGKSKDLRHHASNEGS